MSYQYVANILNLKMPIMINTTNNLFHQTTKKDCRQNMCYKVLVKAIRTP